MTYLRVIALGSIGGVEEWSSGVTYRFFQLSFVSMTQSQLESLVQRLITNIPAATLPAGLKGLLSTAGSLTGWRVESHDENEKLLAVAQNNYAAPIKGTGTPQKSPQDALVISLRTDTPGARGRGRTYWPAIGAGLNATFNLQLPTPQEVADGAKALYKLIGDQINAELAANSLAATVELAVRSGADHLSRQVNRLQVGNVLDTQRRRRDALVESYLVLNYP